MAHLISLRISGPDRVVTVSQSSNPIPSEFKDDDNSLVTTVYVRRIMVLGINAECDPIEPVRAHELEYSGTETTAGRP